MPGMPSSLCAQPPQVTEFYVWLDMMPGPKPSEKPLHAALTIEIQCPPNVTPADIQGRITIQRADGVDVLTSPLQLDGIADATTSGVKQLSFSMQPAPPPVTLTEGEILAGTAKLTVLQQQIEIQLPETPLEFIY